MTDGEPSGKWREIQINKLGFVDVRHWRGSASQAFPLRGRCHGEAVTDEVEKGCEFAGSPAKRAMFPHTSSVSLEADSFPSRGSLGALPRQSNNHTTPNLQSRIASRLQNTAAVYARARPHHFETVYYRTIGSVQKRKIFLKLHKEVHEIRIPDHVKGE